MDPVCADDLLQVAVLGEQRHRRHRPAAKHRLQVFDERKAGAFHLGGLLLVAQFGALHKALRHGFHGAQHARRRTQTHHLKRAFGLMQLLARDAQMAGVERRNVRAQRHVRIAHKAPQRTDRAVQRFAQFIQHPRQRTKVTSRRIQIDSDFGECHGVSRE